MITPNIQSTKLVVPMIYAYSTPEVARHNGWTKIGYTEQDVDTRIAQQTHTADIITKLEWKGNAIFEDGSGDRFTDKDFHAYLRKSGVEQEPGKNNEWFHVDGPTSRGMFYDFKADRGILKSNITAIPYALRAEQEDAVEKTVGYYETHEEGEFLWNAKPRFGKTLSVYDFCKRIDAEKVLIVTNRPAIANSWYSDFMQFLGAESGYAFVSEVEALKDRPGVLSRSEYIKSLDSNTGKIIEFVSLQDMKGSIYFGGQYDKLREISKKEGVVWDVLVVDEAHEGVDTYKTDVAFDQIKRKFTLHLSGTPFKALANNKFPEEAIFNYTYADEQKRKRDWNPESELENPYEVLPKLNLFTYQMSEIIKEELKQGIEIQGETEEYAFDLNEFFATDERGVFRHNSSVDRFLDALTVQKKFPFSTPELRKELKHTFWILDRVASAKALVKKLREHPVFMDYEIVLAAGDGKIDDDDENEKSFDKVVKAIGEHEKTITVSVGQLTTGITIPEWTAVLMLSNMKSPALYMQAAFRAQNPCLFKEGATYKRKEKSYVFDFDPARTLVIFEEFANDLCSSTSSGRGDAESRKEHVRELLNFFPVIGEDENGELIELDAEKVLSIPRKIKSVEVVRRGFMSNFLFQNISNIFNAPKEIVDIIEKFEPVAEPKSKVNLPEEVKENLYIDEDGEVKPPEDVIIGIHAELFGDKKFGENIYDSAKAAESAISALQEDTAYKTEKEKTDALKAQLKAIAKETVVKPAVEVIDEHYGTEIKTSEKKQIESVWNNAIDRKVEKIVTNHQIEKNVIEQDRIAEMQKRHETGKSTEEIEKEFAKKFQEVDNKLADDFNSAIAEFKDQDIKEGVSTAEKKVKEHIKDTIEDTVRDHLRGFSRTIPSFLMAYGDDTVTLATFDNIIPGNVFLEVTSITLDQFKLLRDGGKYIDKETGEEKEYQGHLFDSVVFDDSVKEFLALKKKLADYFDEKSIEDIFDYIPPQKTNQIFTPKDVVKKMVDMLEDENPGCFDRPDKTFIDLYMKSGMYITEIVKRLYQSEKMKELFPDNNQRLRHIFEKQVYGLAPTEIIYNIALSYILGFSDEIDIPKHNFRQADALPYAKENRLQELLDQLYDGDEK